MSGYAIDYGPHRSNPLNQFPFNRIPGVGETQQQYTDRRTAEINAYHDANQRKRDDAGSWIGDAGLKRGRGYGGRKTRRTRKSRRMVKRRKSRRIRR